MCTEAGAQAIVFTIDAGGLVDLNAAPQALLERLVAAVAPARAVMTVHGRQPGLDLMAAPPELLSLLAGPGAETADARQMREMIGRDPELFPIELRARAQGRTFVVRVTVAQPQGGRFMREAVIDLAPQMDRGFVLREWASPTSLFAQRRSLPEPAVSASCRSLLMINDRGEP